MRCGAVSGSHQLRVRIVRKEAKDSGECKVEMISGEEKERANEVAGGGWR